MELVRFAQVTSTCSTSGSAMGIPLLLLALFRSRHPITSNAFDKQPGLENHVDGVASGVSCGQRVPVFEIVRLQSYSITHCRQVATGLGFGMPWQANDRSTNPLHHGLFHGKLVLDIVEVVQQTNKRQA